MVSANYDNVRGVRFSEWTDDDEQEPSTETETARLEELYFDDYSGYLHVSFIVDDRGLYFDIPILPNGDWNELVDALPKWTPNDGD